ncbi:transcriptional regulator [Sinomonas cyclohexanicum]|uniref:Transcriptional regulator n=1 Tax=Sinomonas cyclohexanicum TaxID=322009 RepID=A0ABM7Q0Y5_SINCY|nr:SRPBCC family protein [Corynebacterium cyclohexanicum]BCT78015.1 transcriptional regulator [Corynebacterium cyclohexanicum]
MADTYSAQTSIEINAPIERVWDALVNPETVSRYLHGTTIEADWRPGGAVTWSGEWKGQSYTDKGTVLRYEPPRVVSTTHWSPMAGTADSPENYHHVTYELTEHNGATTLTLTHGNSPTQADADSMVTTSWAPVLADIKRVVEAGPDPGRSV